MSMTKVIEHANCREGCPKALVKAIESRPELARWVLDTLNSERFSLAVTVTSVHHAMVTVGQNTFRQLVLVTAGLTLNF
jgi:c-di-GMP-related signal transduction protein